MTRDELKKQFLYLNNGCGTEAFKKSVSERAMMLGPRDTHIGDYVDYTPLEVDELLHAACQRPYTLEIGDLIHGSCTNNVELTEAERAEMADQVLALMEEVQTSMLFYGHWPVNQEQKKVLDRSEPEMQTIKRKTDE